MPENRAPDDFQSSGSCLKVDFLSLLSKVHSKVPVKKNSHPIHTRECASKRDKEINSNFVFHRLKLFDDNNLTELHPSTHLMSPDDNQKIILYQQRVGDELEQCHNY